MLASSMLFLKAFNFSRRVVSLPRNAYNNTIILKAMYSSGEWGSGAGKGGGSGGAVRDAGGSFGKMEAAREEEYFKKLQRKQLQQLKQHISEEISHHELMISQHQGAIERHNERIKDLKHQVEAQKKVETVIDSSQKE